MHASDSGYAEYLNDWEPGDEFLPFKPTAFRMVAMGKRPIEDAMAALVCHGALTRNPRSAHPLDRERRGLGALPVQASSRTPTRRCRTAFPEDPVVAFKRGVYVAPFWEDDFAQMVDLFGVDRVLFGSDWPHPEGLSDPINLIDDLQGLDCRRPAEGDGRQHDRPVQGPQRDRLQARRARHGIRLIRALVVNVRVGSPARTLTNIESEWRLYRSRLPRNTALRVDHTVLPREGDSPQPRA